MGSGCLRLFVTACWLSAAAASGLAAGRNAPLSTAELLLDLARDHGLKCRGSQRPADVAHIQTLLRAATRLDPRLADAHVWLHELAALRGDRREAARLVRLLVTADPTHAGALARWLDVGVAANQTVEKRAEWLRAQLATGPQRPGFQALLHVHLARLAVARLDRPAAQTHLEQALALHPANPEAAALRLELLDEEAPPAERLRAALKFLQLSPFDVDTAWQVGLLLDQYGFSELADPFYQHALEVYRFANPRALVPAAYHLDLARHAVAREGLEWAVPHVKEVIATDAALAAEAGILLHWLRERQGRMVDAERVRRQLAERFAELREPREFPVNEVAQAAWFHCTIDPQPQRALMLAAAAAKRAPRDVFVTRVLGWAQAVNLQTEKAAQTLRRVADRDPYAAYQLARLLQEDGDEAAAQRVLHELAPVPLAGPAHELLSELGPVAATSQPAAQGYPRIADALAEFDRAVLEFHRQPGRFLQASIELEDRSPNPAEPWWAEFTLTNRAHFPITLGPEGMVNPVFLLSFELEGDRRREYAHLLTINVDHARVILPGRTIRVRRTIDVGPPRRASRMTPQQVQRVVVRAILDPLRGPDGQWRPSVGGQSLRPAYFNRLPAGTSREAMHALFVALRGESDSARFRAVELLAELLSEKQRAALGRLNYRPGPIPARRVRQALLAGLSGGSWELRVRTLDALQLAGLDAQMLRAVEACLEHPHWLVRLMAVRLLGARQGEAAAPRLKSLAEGDADELVRALAASYLTGWEQTAATSQPARAPRGSSERSRSPAP